MTENKHISGIIITLTAVAVLICFVAVCFSSELTKIMGGLKVNMAYETELFDTSKIMSVDIIMDDDDWNDMLLNAQTEQYYVCDVLVNGKKFNNVGIRPKGNSSLLCIVVDKTSDRFSLKLEFDHFVEGQTCFGLDKLVLNNNFVDPTNMKEALIFDMYQFVDANAPLYNYAKVCRNGNYWGVYLALESIDESFMLRNYGTQDSELYKPEPAGMNMDEETDEEFPMSPVGANLEYATDALYQYGSIWSTEVTRTTDKDHRRVVNALKNIKERNDIEKYMNVDNILRYMAVHTFAVNEDSLTDYMPHNYYLYEYDGQLDILPWDYNMSFGAMTLVEENNSTKMINYPIDSPFYYGMQFFGAILENEEYNARYHEYLQTLVDEYIYGGRFDEFYSRTRSQIDTLVAQDPTAFYSAEEYDAAADMLYKTVKLRGDSIDGQLKGTIASTTEAQRSVKGKPTLLDASEIDLKVMGFMDDSIFENMTPEDADQELVMPPLPQRPVDPPSPANEILEITEGYSRKKVITLEICFGVMVVLVVALKFIKPKRT